jgi:hypothetical protein
MRAAVKRREAGALVTVRVLMSKLILAAVSKERGFQTLGRAGPNQLKMNFIFKMPDAILTVHAAEAHR